MKKLIASLILTGLFFISCDKVKHPDQRPPVIPHCVDSINTVVKTNTLTSNTRKVLLEDYTGHLCVNCAPAATEAASIQATYGNRVVILASHVTEQFAKHLTDSFYKEDFRNPASTEWDAYFKVSISGLPKGMVNRTGYPTNHLEPYGNWSSTVPAALAPAQSAKMDITSYYDTVKHYINVKVKTTFKAASVNDINLIVVFTQDSIISDQKNGSNRLTGYNFDNIVIDSFNGAYGDIVKTAPIAVNDTVTKNYSCFLVEKCFFNVPSLPKVCVNDKYVNLVAFVYDVKTNEVLQVEKLRIR